MPKALGEPCPHCDRPMPLNLKEKNRRFYKRHREARLAYSKWYYENVTKPKRQAKRQVETSA